MFVRFFSRTTVYLPKWSYIMFNFDIMSLFIITYSILTFIIIFSFPKVGLVLGILCICATIFMKLFVLVDFPLESFGHILAYITVYEVTSYDLIYIMMLILLLNILWIHKPLESFWLIPTILILLASVSLVILGLATPIETMFIAIILAILLIILMGLVTQQRAAETLKRTVIVIICLVFFRLSEHYLVKTIDISGLSSYIPELIYS